MALRPNNTKIPKLTVSQVLQAREMYFLKYYNLNDIVYEFEEQGIEISRGAVQKAVHGMGKFYSSIKDEISQQAKDERLNVKTIKDAQLWQQQEDARLRKEADRYYEEKRKKLKAENSPWLDYYE